MCARDANRARFAVQSIIKRPHGEYATPGALARFEHDNRTARTP
jgi:hypothetical protein